MLDKERNIVFSAQFGDKSFVSVGFFLSKVKVAVKSLNLIAQTL
jgi:hypothetical protein